MSFDKTRYRQHYIPSPIVFDEPHHWALKWAPSRIMLLSILRKSAWRVPVPQWGLAPELDFELDLLIDQFNLRDLPEPKTLFHRARLAWRCFSTCVRVEAGWL